MQLSVVLRPVHDDDSAALVGGLDHNVNVTDQFAESLRLLRKEVGWGPVDPERITVVQKVSVDQMCDLWRNVILGWDAGGFVGER
jgi:hypothetical protein